MAVLFSIMSRPVAMAAVFRLKPRTMTVLGGSAALGGAAQDWPHQSVKVDDVGRADAADRNRAQYFVGLERLRDSGKGEPGHRHGPKNAISV